MKTGKRVLAMLLSLALLASLAACGGNADETSEVSQKSDAGAGTENAGGADDAGTENAGADNAGTQAAGGDVIKIGAIQLAEHPALDASYQGFVEAMAERGYVDGENIVIDFNNAGGDISNCTTIAEKLVNNGSDLILAIATPAAQAVAAKTTTIPIVGTAVTDFAEAGLVNDNEASGTNVCGSSDMNPIAEQLDLLKQLLPEAGKIGIMYCSSEDNSRVQAELAESICDGLELAWEEYTVSDSSMIQSVAESMIGKVDAVYIPTDNLMAEAMATVTMITNANGLPCIVGEEGMVENGGLATYGLSYYNLGRMAGEMAADVLEGADISAMAVKRVAAEDCTLCINMTAAADLQVTIPEDLSAKATIIE